jgi:hypothetical protein
LNEYPKPRPPAKETVRKRGHPKKSG